MRALMTKDEADELAGVYFPRLAKVVHSGFGDFQLMVGTAGQIGLRTNLKIRTSASLIHDFIRTRAREEFYNDNTVRADEFNGMFGLLISNRMFIRFKKLKRDLQSSNVKTGQVKQFDKQQLELPGIAGLTFLTAGYVPNETWTAIDNIFLTCRLKGQTVWYKDLRYETSQPTIFGLPLIESEPPVVKLKDNDKSGERGTGS
jgi:hypothetical protein